MKKIIFVFAIIASVTAVAANGGPQDPMKTPKNPRMKASGNVDGTNGRYVSDHKQKKSDFTKPKHHIKKSKNSERKSKSSAPAKQG